MKQKIDLGKTENIGKLKMKSALSKSGLVVREGNRVIIGVMTVRGGGRVVISGNMTYTT